MPLSAASPQGTTTSRVLNKLKYAMTDVAADITTAATGDIVVMLDASDDYTPKYADADNIREMTKGIVSVADAATYTVLASNTGKTHVLPNFTSSCTVTLPAAAAGLEYTFIGKAVAADAQNWIFDTGSATNYYVGGLAFADTDAGAGADEIHAGVWPDGNSNDIMTIVTPGAGTRVHLVCDGTLWIVNGQVFSATVPTFAD